MAGISGLQDEWLPAREGTGIPAVQATADCILVFRQYKYHKKLSVELYEAARTREGKLKNPLKPVDPLDLLLHAKEQEVLRFLSCVARYQHNPTMPVTTQSLEALKLIFDNPLKLDCFYHNPVFSDNIVAGSLVPVELGKPVEDLILYVQSGNDAYEVAPRFVINREELSVSPDQLLFENFVLLNNRLHLLGSLHHWHLVRVLRGYGFHFRLPVNRYIEFRQQVLDKLEERVQIRYSFVLAATAEQLAARDGRAMERIVYISDSEPYVLINPVMRYGELETPVRSKKQLYFKDSKGETVWLPRDEDAEDRFTALLIRQHPDFADQLQNDLTHFYLHKERFLEADWFLDAFEIWREQGITVLGFSALKGKRLNNNAANINIRVLSGLNWFNAEVSVVFGKTKASLKKVQQAVRNKSRYVQLDDGTMGLLPHQWIKRLAGWFEAGEVQEKEIQIPKINFPVVEELYDERELSPGVQEELAQLKERLNHFDQVTAVAPPAGLQATLRRYQQEGLNWLNFLDDLGFGGCLADDMGLGKSLQIIALLLLQRTKAPRNTNLLVVPTSLVFNWQEEIAKFAPSLKVHIFYGAGRGVHTNTFDEFELIITTYGALLSDIRYVKKYAFNYVFLDESQNIKNPDSQRYKAVRQLQSRNRIVITGTPFENNTFDLYGQFSFACPGLLGSRQYFREVYAIPIDRFQDRRRAAELQQKIAPFLLRRTKQAVADELPDKTEIVLRCPMNEEQRKVYDLYEKEFRDYMAGIPSEELGHHSIHVLKSLTRLRQICDSPLLIGDDAQQYAETSSKIEMLMEQLVNDTGRHKILVFSQFTGMLSLIRQELNREKIGYAWLTGETRDREAAIQSFRTDERVRVFLISLKAGGVGLNLTEADYVYLVDPWWNPAVENQAIDRCYRIGQKKNVMAVRLICPDTVEEKILKLQETKRAASNDLIQSGDAFFRSLTRTELLKLLR